MRNGLYFLSFAIGAAAGSAVTYCCVKKKYEEIAREEIDSVKEVFSNREREYFREKEDADKEKADEAEYASILQRTGYADISGEEEDAWSGRPYVITPDEFGEDGDYDQIGLSYYADGILADENDEVIENAEELIGDALNHFGEYEDEAVYVRSEKLRCDYEILIDRRRFSDVAWGTMRQTEEV